MIHFQVAEDYVVTGETEHPVIPELATTYAHLRAVENFLRTDKSILEFELHLNK